MTDDFAKYVEEFENATLLMAKRHKVDDRLCEQRGVARMITVIFEKGPWPNLIRNDLLAVSSTQDMRKFHTSMRSARGSTLKADGGIRPWVDL